MVVLSLTHDAKLLAHFTLLFYFVFLRVLSVCSLIYFFSLEDSVHQWGMVSFKGQKTNCSKFTPSGQLFTEIVWRWEHLAGHPSPRLFLSMCFTDMTIMPLCLQTHHFIPEPWLLKPQHQVLPLCSKGGSSGRAENRIPGSTSQ